ncbi:MAG: sulfatase [Planctomycetales bacterium]|nr:sulfatase [Planctomycetales bacterium]
MACLAVLLSQRAVSAENALPPAPNLVVIFIDDMGYADVGPFGCETYPTPNLDRLAAEGRCFTDFHAATAVCSASRAALLTGCYPERVGILGALGPRARIGINPDEYTLAELCRDHGYATAIFGKWHLGDREPFLPLQHGFDEYFGLPYSNDMWPMHPDLAGKSAAERKKGYPDLPLYEGNEVADAEVTSEDQNQLTTQYTERAVDFIRRQGDKPFFLYVPHSMVHVPLHVSDKFRGQSGAGLFGDVVMEVDWSVGQILAALEETGVAENTWVVFTSDNGPWLSYGDHAGSAGDLREGKGTMFEGGYREPCIMRWPGVIPAGSECDELCTTMDILPTMARLLGAELPADRTIDGHEILPLMTGAADAKSPYEAFWCYYGGELQAVRDPRWKLHMPHAYRTLAGKPGGTGGLPADYQQAKIGLVLFDLRADRGETADVADQHPEIVERLLAEAEQARAELGDKLTAAAGSGVRPPGRVAAANSK